MIDQLYVRITIQVLATNAKEMNWRTPRKKRKLKGKNIVKGIREIQTSLMYTS